MLRPPSIEQWNFRKNTRETALLLLLIGSAQVKSHLSIGRCKNCCYPHWYLSVLFWPRQARALNAFLCIYWLACGVAVCMRVEHLIGIHGTRKMNIARRPKAKTIKFSLSLHQSDRIERPNNHTKLNWDSARSKRASARSHSTHNHRPMVPK